MPSISSKIAEGLRAWLRCAAALFWASLSRSSLAYDKWWKPVPAGIKRPMITFSFNPLNKSFLPSTAASVKILVVSWKDAADIKLSVFKDAFVIPNNIYSQVASCPSCSFTALFSFSKVWTSTNSPGNKFVSPGSIILTFLVIWRTIISTCLSAISTPCER